MPEGSGLDEVEKEFFRRLWAYGSGPGTLSGGGGLRDLVQDPPDEYKATMEKFFNAPLVETKDKVFTYKARTELFDPKKHGHVLDPAFVTTEEEGGEDDDSDTGC